MVSHLPIFRKLWQSLLLVLEFSSSLLLVLSTFGLRGVVVMALTSHLRGAGFDSRPG